MSTLRRTAAGPGGCRRRAHRLDRGAGFAGQLPRAARHRLPPLAANVTNTTSMLATTVGSALGSRPELVGQWPRLRVLMPQSALGGLVGAGLLAADESTFETVVPWLVALGAVLLLMRDRLRRWSERRRARLVSGEPPPPVVTSWRGHLLIVVVGVYGGYFGAGVGIILLAMLAVRTAEPLAVTNAVKNVASGTANVAASLTPFTAASRPTTQTATRSSPSADHRQMANSRCASHPAQIRQVSSRCVFEGRKRRLLAYAFAPCSPDPHHLAVLARPGFVRAACHPPRHLPGQAALSFRSPAATDPRSRPSTSTPSTSASRRTRAKTHADFGLRQPTPGVFVWRTPTGHTYTVEPEPLPVGHWPSPTVHDDTTTLAELIDLDDPDPPLWESTVTDALEPHEGHQILLHHETAALTAGPAP